MCVRLCECDSERGKVQGLGDRSWKGLNKVKYSEQGFIDNKVRESEVGSKVGLMRAGEYRQAGPASRRLDWPMPSTHTTVP